MTENTTAETTGSKLANETQSTKQIRAVLSLCRPSHKTPSASKSRMMARLAG
ncbi:MAG TPA: hypothetical protein QF359_10275 [Rhodospirillales bacterium]|jgi:hypothetical protein|nr:hypothetical protein [Rhodospirillales bacterium]